MAKNLVIVESPAKAKTIEKFLGTDFKVVSSYGHIRDLSQKNMGIDIEKGFEPDYVVSDDKKDLVKELKKLTKSSELVWLATDEDREGEAIAWHLAEELKLTKEQTRRIVFHEITKPAILKAVDNPRSIDYHLVNAQQARRVLDRLVGFEVSPVLWRKVKQGLSAGRVQSVAVRLIVEREREIQAFESKSQYRVTAIFENKDGSQIQAELPKKFATKKEAEAYLNDCLGKQFKVSSIETKPAKKSPAPPFTTSTLQQEASRKLGYSVSQTMMLAQRLYEAGKITYMRTDSLNLSQEAIAKAKEQIEKQFGPEYSKTRSFATKSKGAQEAHEAIRPTDMSVTDGSDDNQQQRLYDLIWKRTLASQMEDAKLERTNVSIESEGVSPSFSAKGEVITFEGFLKVYLEGKDDEDPEEAKGVLPKMTEGEELNQKEITATERFTKHPARFTEAALVKKLEELGIGRPSTYAPTISTIQRRQYIIKSDLEGTLRDYQVLSLVDNKIDNKTEQEKTGFDKNKLIPTDIGLVVNDFLVENFKDILDYHFTAKVEEEFDEIADGKKKWNAMIDDFYGDFHSKVEHVKEHSERSVGERLLGVDPKSGKNVYVKIGRFGPMAQIGESNTEEEKPRFVGLRKGMSIESVTYEEVMELFKLPRTLGEYEGEEVVAGLGRFGPFVRHKGKFVSIGKEDPMTIELDLAIELIEAKRKAEREKFINAFDEEEPHIQVLNGRYGPYITAEKKNYKIPKDLDPKELTREDCLKIIKEAPAAKKKSRAKKKK